jgi:hypothetical protein
LSGRAIIFGIFVGMQAVSRINLVRAHDTYKTRPATARPLRWLHRVEDEFGENSMMSNQWRLARLFVIVMALAVPAMASANPGRGEKRPPVDKGHRHHCCEHWRHHGWNWGWGWNWGAADALAVIELQRAQEAADAQQNQAASLEAQLAAMQQQMQMAALRQAQAQVAKPPTQGQPVKPQPVAVPENRQVNERPAKATVVPTSEERGAGKYKLAMRLAAEGKTDDAADYCAEILRKYPDTAAAEQAKSYLDKNGKR